MPKQAIKHIKAGPLNIRVLGHVPDQEVKGRGRAARARVTSLAQKFYNEKRSWQELELRIAANFGKRDMVLTFTFDDEHLPNSKAKARKLFSRFVDRLRRARGKREQEVRYIAVAEGFHGKASNEFLEDDGYLEDRRFHLHVILNSTGNSDLEEIRSLWNYGGYIRAERLDVHYYQALAKYMTKEAREFARPKPGEQTWSCSKNLQKPEIEYIEVPDGLRLSPPYGAQDYTEFYDHNPYGYAPLVGDRYLLFAREDRTNYSYTRGRNT